MGDRSRVLAGADREATVRRHLDWLNGRWPSEAVRAAEHDHRADDTPIAIWARSRCLALARGRSRVRWGSGNNRKRFDRKDDAPPLIDEVST